MEGSGFMLEQHTALDNTAPGTSHSNHLSQHSQRTEEKRVVHTATCACARCSCVLKAIVRAGLHITKVAASELLPVSSNDLRELTTVRKRKKERKENDEDVEDLNEEVDKGHEAPCDHPKWCRNNKTIDCVLLYDNLAILGNELVLKPLSGIWLRMTLSLITPKMYLMFVF